MNVSIDKFDLLAQAFGIRLHLLFDTRRLDADGDWSKPPGVKEPRAAYGLEEELALPVEGVPRVG